MSTEPQNIFILFGATGDLSRIKIIGSLFSLHKNNAIKNLKVIAVSRRNYSDDEYRDFARKEVVFPDASKEDIDTFLSIITYIEGTFDEKNLYKNIKEKVSLQDTVVSYLATAPHFFKDIIVHGSGAGLWDTTDKIKILLEKPYAETERELIELQKIVRTHVRNKTLFVDHYLGKTPLIHFPKVRRSNKELEYAIEHDIEEVRVRFFEKHDADRRGELYDNLGAFADVGANHMIQMLGATLAPFENEERLYIKKLIESLSLDKTSSSSYQYEGYRDVSGVDKKSKTETAFALTLQSKLPYLKGVPIYFSGGKAFNAFANDVEITFKKGKKIKIKIKPEEEIVSTFFGVEEIWSAAREAYEVIIEKAFVGDDSYFVSFDEIKEEWKLIKAVRNCFESQEPIFYKKGAKFLT